MRPAVQLYTLRRLLAEDLEATLDAIAADVELAGLYGRSADRFRGALDAVARPPSCHTAVAL